MSERVNKPWYQRRPPRDRKVEIMRRATANAESRYSVGGQVKTGGHKPRPVTLPKMPWDDGGERR